jgi:hypothetical protein
LAEYFARKAMELPEDLQGISDITEATGLLEGATV